MTYSINQDCCVLCGKTGLQMLQEGLSSDKKHECKEDDIEAYARKLGWDDWLYEARFYL